MLLYLNSCMANSPGIELIDIHNDIHPKKIKICIEKNLFFLYFLKIINE
jgi:hypothetical protein